jgi:hypothetical protein
MFTMGSQQESVQTSHGRRYSRGDLQAGGASMAATNPTTVIGGTTGKLSLRWQKIQKGSEMSRHGTPFTLLNPGDSSGAKWSSGPRRYGFPPKKQHSRRRLLE